MKKFMVTVMLLAIGIVGFVIYGMVAMERKYEQELVQLERQLTDKDCDNRMLYMVNGALTSMCKYPGTRIGRECWEDSLRDDVIALLYRNCRNGRYVRGTK